MKMKTTAKMACGLLMAMMAAVQAQAAEIRMKATETRVIELAERPGTVIVSNPEYVSIHMLGRKKMLIQGLAAGYTNLLVLNRKGEKVADIDININSRNDRRILRVFKAGKRYTYVCNPECAPSYTMHDHPNAIGDLLTRIGLSRALARRANQNVKDVAKGVPRPQ